MNQMPARFEAILQTFPAATHAILQMALQNAGKLEPDHWRQLTRIMAISVEELMLHLLPLAQQYAQTPISHFPVGAAIKASTVNDKDDSRIYLGANHECVGINLSQTIHAEQAATINAWMQGAGQIQTIAVSAAPCGLCRQFLYEAEGRQPIEVIVPATENSQFQRITLSELLPAAFGPADLNQPSGFMAASTSEKEFALKTPSADPLVRAALSAARLSYAPYTHNLAGCALVTAAGKTYTGRYAENAAFNPGVSPLHAAMVCLWMDLCGADPHIIRAVLVEKPTTCSQRAIAELLLKTYAPGIHLEYFEAD